MSRLMQLSWRKDPDPRVVVSLMRLYLRPSARWAITLGCEAARPFFDAAYRACTDVRAPEAEEQARLDALLDASLAPTARGETVSAEDFLGRLPR